MPAGWLAALWLLHEDNSVMLSWYFFPYRGTTGLGIQLVSEARGAGAVVDRYVWPPEETHCRPRSD